MFGKIFNPAPLEYTPSRRIIVTWILAGIFGLLAYAFFNEKIFPLLNVNIRVAPERAIATADDFLKREEFSSSEYERAVVFSSCSTEYLQEKMGITKTIALLQKDIPCWSWDVRYFRELQPEGFYVSVDALNGAVKNFYHTLPESTEGKKISENEAKTLAEGILKRQNYDMAQYELKTNSHKDLPKRRDYFFEWEKKNYKIADATLRVMLQIHGDRLGMLLKYLEIPEKFYRDMTHKTTVGIIITLIFSAAIGIVALASLFILLIQCKYGSVRWRLAIIFGALLLPIRFLNFYNTLPSFWYSYPDTTYKAIYFWISAVSLCLGGVFTGGFIFLICAAGESLSRKLNLPGFYLLEALKEPRKFSNKIISIYTIGYSFAFCMMGYEVLFYFLGTQWKHVWIPLSFSYSGMLSSKMPFLEPLTVGTSAALLEEFLFRLYMIALFTKLFKRPWLSVVLQAVLWAFAHSNYAIYPNFTRGIELTIVGIALGMIYLKCGIETTVIAHYVYNAVTAGWLLFQSGNYYFVSSGVLVLLLVFIPILPVYLSKRYAKSRK
ncbi:MAG: type II CAAX endopeptidase family protein [Candidatus Omnitrophica bacterium]|nr:type II CAAX endopeptidase family protein [Candidatus Omnitrophota bacterium]